MSNLLEMLLIKSWGDCLFPVPDESASDYPIYAGYSLFNCGEIDCLSLFLMNHLADYYHGL
jgi:hypothetical protein